MSIWELRQAIESALPAWLSVVSFAFAVIVLAYGWVKRRGSR